MTSMRPPTMEDVARAARVSRSTVSRVFQDGASVSPEVQIRVREAAQELGYVPNLVASELATGARSQLGLLIRDATNPAYGHLHTEMHRAVERTGRHLVSVTAFRHEYGRTEVEGLHRLIGLRVGGLFVATGVTAPEDLAAAAAAVPLLILGRPNDDPTLESVSYDERTHARLVIERIAGLGHRRIGVLTAPLLYSRVFDLRMRSTRESAAELGLTAVPIDLLPVAEGVERALDAAAAQSLTCIVCPVDYVALELLRAASRRGLRVPEDLSVVGFDGLSEGLDLIGLTTVRLPVAEVAADAARRMDELLAGSPSRAAAPDRAAPARHRLHVGSLVEGRSLGHPPR